MTMNLSDEDAKRLLEAVRSGRYGSEQEALSAAIRLLDGDPKQETKPQTKEEAAEWMARYREWTQRRRGPGNPNMDDSRESIYEGCGE